MMVAPQYRQLKPIIVYCPYCRGEAKLVDSSIVYGGRSYGMIWWCKPCDAYVGCNKNSRRHAPLGRLANKELRGYKQLAHKAFDPIWRDSTQHHARARAYTWLAAELCISQHLCHIGLFDVDTCKQVIDVCLKSEMQRDG